MDSLNAIHFTNSAFIQLSPVVLKSIYYFNHPLPCSPPNIDIVFWAQSKFSPWILLSLAIAPVGFRLADNWIALKRLHVDTVDWFDRFITLFAVEDFAAIHPRSVHFIDWWSIKFSTKFFAFQPRLDRWGQRPRGSAGEDLVLNRPWWSTIKVRIWRYNKGTRQRVSITTVPPGAPSSQ